MNKRKRIFLNAISSILISMMILGTTLQITAQDNTRVAKISELNGTVKILKSGGEKSFPAFKGMGLNQGDTITTEKDAWVQVKLDDDKEMIIAENSRIMIKELTSFQASQSTKIQLWTGAVLTDIKKQLNVDSKYEVQTPTAVMGVRGTQFLVIKQGITTECLVFDGTVEATSIGGDTSQNITIPPNNLLSILQKPDDLSENDDDLDRLRNNIFHFVSNIAKESYEIRDPALMNELMKEIMKTREERLQEQQRLQELQRLQQQRQAMDRPPATIIEDKDVSSGTSATSGGNSSDSDPGRTIDNGTMIVFAKDNDNIPLPGMLVDLRGIQKETNSDGKATFNSVPNGEYTITVTDNKYFGYETKVIDKVKVESGGTKAITLNLSLLPGTLKTNGLKPNHELYSYARLTTFELNPAAVLPNFLSDNIRVEFTTVTNTVYSKYTTEPVKFAFGSGKTIKSIKDFVAGAKNQEGKLLGDAIDIQIVDKYNREELQLTTYERGKDLNLIFEIINADSDTIDAIQKAFGIDNKTKETSIYLSPYTIAFFEVNGTFYRLDDLNSIFANHADVDSIGKYILKANSENFQSISEVANVYNFENKEIIIRVKPTDLHPNPTIQFSINDKNDGYDSTTIEDAFGLKAQ